MIHGGPLGFLQVDLASMGHDIINIRVGTALILTVAEFHTAVTFDLLLAMCLDEFHMESIDLDRRSTGIKSTLRDSTTVC